MQLFIKIINKFFNWFGVNFYLSLNNSLLRSNNKVNFKHYYSSYVPDRYSANLAKYHKKESFLDFNDLDAWVAGNYDNNMGDLSRFFQFNLCFDSLLNEKISGNVAEIGVYKGNSARLLAKFARKINSTCYLFDTFEGFDSRDVQGVDAATSTEFFKDTSLENVQQLVGTENTVYVKGYFPESLTQIEDPSNFCLVHIDCDLEKPIRASLAYFYPRMVEGGYLVLHDYSSLYWPGAKKAIDEFFEDKPEFIIPMPDKSGSCIVRKIKSS